MHADHAGCVEFFRKSQLIVHADEFAAVIAAHAANDDTNYAWRDTDAGSAPSWIGDRFQQ